MLDKKTWQPLTCSQTARYIERVESRKKPFSLMRTNRLQICARTIGCGTVFLLGLLLVGCAHVDKSNHTFSFSQRNIDRWHRGALEAANSPETWRAVNSVRISQGPIKFDEDVEYTFNLDYPDRIFVYALTDRVAEGHRCHLEFTLDLTTGIAISMQENLFMSVYESQMRAHGKKIENSVNK